MYYLYIRPRYNSFNTLLLTPDEPKKSYETCFHHQCVLDDFELIKSKLNTLHLKLVSESNATIEYEIPIKFMSEVKEFITQL